MAIAAVGLFILGLGNFTIVRFSFAIISSITERELANKFISCLPLGVTTGGIILSYFYTLVKHWRFMTLYFQLIPSILLLLATFFLLEDPPESLLKTKNLERIRNALNKIGRINTGEDNIISEREIEEYLEEASNMHQIKESTNPLDLFRYPSIRKETIAFMFMELLIQMNYLSAGVIVDKFGFSPSLNLILLYCAEYASLPFLIAFSSKVKRKLFGILVISLSTLLSFITVTVEVPPNC